MSSSVKGKHSRELAEAMLEVLAGEGIPSGEVVTAQGVSWFTLDFSELGEYKVTVENLSKVG
jgi:hypothetical protein